MTLSLSVQDVEGQQMPQAIRTLLLDDSNFDRARIKRMAAKTNLPIYMDEVGSIEEMDAAVRRAAYDLILIDYRLPQGDGLTALDHIQRDPMNCDAGTIMITGNGALDTAVTAMRNGCHDYLTKDAITTSVLQNAMINAMDLAAKRRQMTAQTAHQREIIRLGLTDALNDEAVQGTVVSLMRHHLNNTPVERPVFQRDLDPGEIDALLAGMDDDDEFIFH